MDSKCYDTQNLETAEKTSAQDGTSSFSSVNVSTSDLDEDVKSKLRGDAIGDTLYSQSFVLKSLLQFSNLEWNEQVEEDLCFLWDMTVEKDVCEYLFEISYPSLSCAAMEKYKENRFLEIVIGILANILCAGCDKTVSDEEISIVLKELDSDDPLLLVQVMRFISTVAHKKTALPFITHEVMDKIIFILNNSINTELLAKTLETVTKVTVDFKLDPAVVSLELYDATLTGYGTFIGDDRSFDSKERLVACRYMLESINNICGYVDHCDNCALLLDLQRNSGKFVHEIIKILEYFSSEENLFPVTEEFIFFMSVFRYVFTTLNVNYNSSSFILFSKILFLILDAKDVSDLFECVLEIICFLLSRSSVQQAQTDLKKISKTKVQCLLKFVNENRHNYKFTLNIQDIHNLYK